MLMQQRAQNVADLEFPAGSGTRSDLSPLLHSRSIAAWREPRSKRTVYVAAESAALFFSHRANLPALCRPMAQGRQRRRAVRKIAAGGALCHVDYSAIIGRAPGGKGVSRSLNAASDFRP